MTDNDELARGGTVAAATIGLVLVGSILLSALIVHITASMAPKTVAKSQPITTEPARAPRPGNSQK